MRLNYNKPKNYSLKFNRMEIRTKNSCSLSYSCSFKWIFKVFLVLQNDKIAFIVLVLSFVLQSLHVVVLFYVILFCKIACSLRFLVWFFLLFFHPWTVQLKWEPKQLWFWFWFWVVPTVFLHFALHFQTHNKLCFKDKE